MQEVLNSLAIPAGPHFEGPPSHPSISHPSPGLASQMTSVSDQVFDLVTGQQPSGNAPTPPPHPPASRKAVDEVQLLSCHRSNWRYEAPQSAKRWHPSSPLIPKPATYAVPRRIGPPPVQDPQADPGTQCTNSLQDAAAVVPTPVSPEAADAPLDVWGQASEAPVTLEGVAEIPPAVAPDVQQLEDVLEIPPAVAPDVQQLEDVLEIPPAVAPDVQQLEDVAEIPPAVAPDVQQLEDVLEIPPAVAPDVQQLEDVAEIPPAVAPDVQQPISADAVASPDFIYPEPGPDRTKPEDCCGELVGSATSGGIERDAGVVATAANGCIQVPSSSSTEGGMSDGPSFTAEFHESPGLESESALADSPHHPWCPELGDHPLPAFVCFNCALVDRSRDAEVHAVTADASTLTDQGCWADMATDAIRIVTTDQATQMDYRPDTETNLLSREVALASLRDPLLTVFWECILGLQDWEEQGRQCIASLEEMERQMLVDRMLESWRPPRPPSRPKTSMSVWEKINALHLQQKLAHTLEALAQAQQCAEEEKTCRVGLQEQVAVQDGTVAALQEEVGKLMQDFLAEKQRSSQLEAKVKELQQELLLSLQQPEVSPVVMHTQPDGSKRRVTFAEPLSSLPVPGEASSSSSSGVGPSTAVGAPKGPALVQCSPPPAHSTAGPDFSPCRPPCTGGATHADPPTLPAPRDAVDFVVGLEERLRASIELQERDLKAWLVESWTIITAHAKLEALQGQENMGRRCLRKEALCAGPWAPRSVYGFLWKHWEECRRRTAQEEQHGWQAVVDHWALALGTLPLQGQLALLRRHAAGSNAVRQQEAQDRGGLVQAWEAQLLALLRQQATLQSAQRVVEVWENQRWLPFKGWGSQLLPQDPGPFCDARGKAVTLEAISSQVTHGGFGWLTPWELDISQASGEDGWHYMVDFRASSFLPKSSIRTTVRRRKWVRQCLPAKALQCRRPPELPSALPRPLLESWQQVSGCVHLYTAAGLPLWVPPSYEGLSPVGVGAQHGPTAFAVEPLRGHLGSFQLRETRFGTILAMPRKDAGPGTRLFCAPNPGKETCCLELLYTDRAGTFRVRSSAHGCFWRVDTTGRSVLSTAFPDLASDFCIVAASPT